MRKSRMAWMEPYIQETAAGTFLFNDGKVYIWNEATQQWVLTTGDDLIFDTPNRP